MIPLRMPGETRAMGAPKDWNSEARGHCSVLSIQDVQEQPGMNWQISRWEPSPEELAILNAGGSVELGIAGVAHPVVFVRTAERVVLD